MRVLFKTIVGSSVVDTHGLTPVALAIDHSIKSLTALTLPILTYAIKDRYGAIDAVANDGGQSCYNE